jgi:hypothetical protein
MKTYEIYVSPLGNQEAVKKGWSWPGFFFGGFWTLYKKMWINSLYIFLLQVALIGLTYAVDPKSSANFGFFFGLVIGYFGNKWRVKNLMSRGFENSGIVVAKNPEAALNLWTKQKEENK